MKNRILLQTGLFIVAIFAISGCGGLRNDVAGNVDSANLQPAVTAGKAILRGTIYSPLDVSAAKQAGRSTAVPMLRNTRVPNAPVTLMRMDKTGDMAPAGPQFITTTNTKGEYEIPSVPIEDNLVVVASAEVTVDGQKKTLKLQTVVSVTEEDAAAGMIQEVDADVASTFCVNALQEIVKTVNNGKSPEAMVAPAELPREKITEIKTQIDKALADDQESGNPQVDIIASVMGSSAEVAAQFANLTGSETGASIKGSMDSVSTKGNLRVMTQTMPSGTFEPAQAAMLGNVTVVVTAGDIARTAVTDAAGTAFFDNIDADTTLNIVATLKGYRMATTQTTITEAARTKTLKIILPPVSTNQAPVAKAGPDRNVLQKALVTLSGVESFDPDGDAITYSWTWVKGPAQITLNSPSSATTTFTADVFGKYTFQLIVSDGSLASATDEVIVNVTSVACFTDVDCDDSDTHTLDVCVSPGIAEAACTHAAIACLSQADCDDSNEHTLDTCASAGATDSSCIHADIICLSDADCNDSNPATLDTCSNAATVASSCSYETYCGNNFVEQGEECDDGANASGDGCSAACKAEAPYYWITIPAGDFVMGCADGDTQCASFEKPKHTVTLSAYQIMKHAVTNAQYKDCVDNGPCPAPGNTASATRPSYFGNPVYDNYPVIFTDQVRANAFCNWIGGRIPTDAEWEKAARGPYPREPKYPWGDDPVSCTLSNYDACTGDTDPVDSHAPGASYYGLLNMSGNVWETTSDWLSATYYATGGPPWVDPQGPAAPDTPNVTSVRGGCFSRAASYQRNSQFATSPVAGTGGNYSGFRCVR